MRHHFSNENLFREKGRLGGIVVCSVDTLSNLSRVRYTRWNYEWPAQKGGPSVDFWQALNGEKSVRTRGS